MPASPSVLYPICGGCVVPQERLIEERLRVTVTRGSDVGKRFLVLREIEAYHAATD